LTRINDRGGRPNHHTDRHSEAALLKRARAGDHVAWDELVRRNRPTLVAVARGTPRATYEDPEDVVQRALGRAWRLRSSIQPGRGSFQGWAARIVRRAGYDSSRAQRHQQTLLAEAALTEGDLPGIANGGASPPQPDDVVATRWRQVLSRRVVAVCLPRLTRLEAAVLSHAMAGGTGASFQKADGSPYSPAAYRQTLRRARGKVRLLAET
jgi:DNA-directed RNA polymerase specialized sigma24 family protein